MVAAVTVGLLLTACGSWAAAEQPRGQEGAPGRAREFRESLGVGEPAPDTAARRGHFVELKTPADYRPTPRPGAPTTTDASCSTRDSLRPELVSGVNIIPATRTSCIT